MEMSIEYIAGYDWARLREVLREKVWKFSVDLRNIVPTWRAFKHPRPIISPGTIDPSGAGTVSFIYKHDLERPYVLFYEALYEAGIVRADSADGLTWTKSSDYVLKRDKSYDLNGIGDQSVLWDLLDGLYYMWYEGRGEDGVRRICLATSQDGIKWTKHGPVLGPWDVLEIIGARVAKKDDEYFMLIQARPKGTGRNQLYLSKSTDPKSFPIPKPVFLFSPQSPVCYFSLDDATLYWMNGYWLMLYAAHNRSDMERSLTIRAAVSYDAEVWVDVGEVVEASAGYRLVHEPCLGWTPEGYRLFFTHHHHSENKGYIWFAWMPLDMEKFVQPLIDVDSIAAGGEVHVDLDDVWQEAASLTVRVTYGAGASAGVRVYLLSSPDYNFANLDSENSTDAFTYFDPSFTAGGTVQRTINVDALPKNIRILVRNLDSAVATGPVKVWITRCFR